MKVVISAGGTGGHIYPALAIINKIKEEDKNSEFLYIGTHNRMEKDIVPKYNIPFQAIEIYGLNRKKVFKNFKSVFCLIKSYFKCKKLIKKFKPDIVIGVGGYVTAPVILSAHSLKIKTIIHEQNSIPGKSNLFLSKYVDKILVSFSSSMKYFPVDKVLFTGNPCSEEALKGKVISKEIFSLSVDKKLVYIVMGSLGSSRVNNIIKSALPLFSNKEYEVLFVTGKELYEELKEIEYSSNVKIVPYVENQSHFLKNVDLIVTRCGATTLSEIIALKIPAILIPSPYVPNNHQFKNGYDLVKRESAIMIEEKNLTEETLINEIDTLINDSEKLNILKKNLSFFDIKNSATIIYNEIKSLVDRKRL